jgi:hypothetical protein
MERPSSVAVSFKDQTAQGGPYIAVNKFLYDESFVRNFMKFNLNVTVK